MHASTLSVCDTGSGIVLMLKPSPELLREQARVVALLPGQRPIRELHVTLVSSAGAANAFPPAPSRVDFCNQAYWVADRGKASVYLRASDASQSALVAYVGELEQRLGRCRRKDPERIFHVSLSNLSGLPKDSVARIWQFPAKPV